MRAGTFLLREYVQTMLLDLIYAWVLIERPIKLNWINLIKDWANFILYNLGIYSLVFWILLNIVISDFQKKGKRKQ